MDYSPLTKNHLMSGNNLNFFSCSFDSLLFCLLSLNGLRNFERDAGNNFFFYFEVILTISCFPLKFVYPLVEDKCVRPGTIDSYYYLRLHRKIE